MFVGAEERSIMARLVMESGGSVPQNWDLSVVSFHVCTPWAKSTIVCASCPVRMELWGAGYLDRMLRSEVVWGRCVIFSFRNKRAIADGPAPWYMRWEELFSRCLMSRDCLFSISEIRCVVRYRSIISCVTAVDDAGKFGSYPVTANDNGAAAFTMFWWSLSVSFGTCL